MILKLSNQKQLDKAKYRFNYLCGKGAEVELREIKPTRSSRQSRALHLYFKFISQELKEMGSEFIYQGIKGYEISTPYTPDIVKNFFWRAIQISLFDIESTTDINTNQMNMIIEITNKFFAERGVDIIFPSIESLVMRYDL